VLFGNFSAMEMPFGLWTRVGPRKHVLDGVHIVATWRIRLNRPCAVFLSNYFDHTCYWYVTGVYCAETHWNEGRSGATVLLVVVVVVLCWRPACWRPSWRPVFTAMSMYSSSRLVITASITHHSRRLASPDDRIPHPTTQVTVTALSFLPLSAARSSATHLLPAAAASPLDHLNVQLSPHFSLVLCSTLCANFLSSLGLN